MYRPISAGDLTHQVRIEQKVETQSSSGALVPVWTLLRQVWAKVESLNGKEYMAAQQIISKVQSRAVIRYKGNTDVTANMRLVFGAAIYNIEDVLPDERFAEALVLMLSSGANDG